MAKKKKNQDPIEGDPNSDTARKERGAFTKADAAAGAKVNQPTVTITPNSATTIKGGGGENPANTEKSGVFIDPTTGNQAGITTKDNKTFFGLGPSDIKQIADAEAAKQQMPQGYAQQGMSQQDILRKGVANNPASFGLLKPGEQPANTGDFQTVTQDASGQKYVEFQQSTDGGPPQTVRMPVSDEQFNQIQAQGLGSFLEMAALGLGAGPAASAWKIGEEVVASESAAVQLGNAAKNEAKLMPLLGKLKGFAGGVFTAIVGGKIIDILTGAKKIDEIQQATNTIGQMASTIGGQAQEGAGDWRKGLEQLQYLKAEVLRLERAMKTGEIASASIKYNGKIYDINADVSDQLATINEQITIIQSFALQGAFPEMDKLTMQEQLRQLEKEGYIQPTINNEEIRR